MNHEIFREYDIRGIVDKELTIEVAYLLGKAFSTYLLKNNRNQLTLSGYPFHQNIF